MLHADNPQPLTLWPMAAPPLVRFWRPCDVRDGGILERMLPRSTQEAWRRQITYHFCIASRHIRLCWHGIMYLEDQFWDLGMSLWYYMTLHLNLICDVCRWCLVWYQSLVILIILVSMITHPWSLDISELMGGMTRASLLSLSLSLCLVLQVAWIYSRLLAFR